MDNEKEQITKPISKELKPPEPIIIKQGVLKWFDYNRNYGFIQYDNDKEIFVHLRAVRRAQKLQLIEGDAVQFEVFSTKRGPQARNVEKLNFVKNFALDTGEKYFERHVNEKTPFIFKMINNKIIYGALTEDKIYDFDITTEDEQKIIVKKIDIKCIFKKYYRTYVNTATQVNENIKSKNLPISPKVKERYQIPNKELFDAWQNAKNVCITLVDGEEFVGTVNWFTKYELLFKCHEKATIIIFRHAVLNFASLDSVTATISKNEQASQTNPQFTGKRKIIRK
jgi:CspA family cold shock protein